MSKKKPTQKKPPLVIEPLNWVAPDAKRAKAEDSDDDAQQSSAKSSDKN